MIDIEQQRGSCNNCHAGAVQLRSSMGDSQPLSRDIGEDIETFDGRLQRIIQIDAQQSAGKWEIGDHLVEMMLGGPEARWDAIAEESGIEKHTLRQYHYVSSRYRADDRSSALTWTHHLRIASLNNRVEWLQKAVAGGWSVRQMLDAIKDAERGHEPSKAGAGDTEEPGKAAAAPAQEAENGVEHQFAPGEPVETGHPYKVAHDPAQPVGDWTVMVDPLTLEMQQAAEAYVASLSEVPTNPVELAYGAIYFWVNESDRHGDASDC